MYDEALALVESLMDAEPGSKKEEELEVWTLIIEQYEKEHHPVESPDHARKNMSSPALPT